MVCVTDDERRRMAARLRASRTHEHDDSLFEAMCVLHTLGLFYYDIDRLWFNRQGVEDLADLIDPDTTTDTTKPAADTTICDASATHTDASATRDTSLSRRDTVACESGQNQDTNQDTVQIESPAVPKAPECDREALLALASWAKSNAWYFALDHPEDELRDRLTEAAEYFSEVDSTIREACGEVGA